MLSSNSKKIDPSSRRDPWPACSLARKIAGTQRESPRSHLLSRLIPTQEDVARLACGLRWFAEADVALIAPSSLAAAFMYGLSRRGLNHSTGVRPRQHGINRAQSVEGGANA